MRLGDFVIDVVSGGTFRLDGGAMFGVVPRPMWMKVRPPDELNRVALATNCLLVRADGRTILIDTGYGSKHDSRMRERSCLEEGHPLLRNLEQRGVSADDVDVVILSHLHFDHAGGATVATGGTIRPTFPNATYYVQQTEWDDASANLPELAGSYDRDDFVPLHAAGVLRLLNGDTEILPGVSVVHTGGHTRGHQIVRLESGGATLVYLADLCPFTTHLKRLWTMAYDQFSLTTRRVKYAALQRALQSGAIVVFDHDPETPAAYLKSDGKDGFAIGDVPTGLVREQRS